MAHAFAIKPKPSPQSLPKRRPMWGREPEGTLAQGRRLSSKEQGIARASGADPSNLSLERSADTDHFLKLNKTLAAASRSRIYVRSDAEQRPDIDHILAHEATHIATWQHGGDKRSAVRFYSNEDPLREGAPTQNPDSLPPEVYTDLPTEFELMGMSADDTAPGAGVTLPARSHPGSASYFERPKRNTKPTLDSGSDITFSIDPDSRRIVPDKYTPATAPVITHMIREGKDEYDQRTLSAGEAGLRIYSDPNMQAFGLMGADVANYSRLFSPPRGPAPLARVNKPVPRRLPRPRSTTCGSCRRGTPRSSK